MVNRSPISSTSWRSAARGAFCACAFALIPAFLLPATAFAAAQTFNEWCVRFDQLPASQRATVEIVIEAAVRFAYRLEQPVVELAAFKAAPAQRGTLCAQIASTLTTWFAKERDYEFDPHEHGWPDLAPLASLDGVEALKLKCYVGVRPRGFEALAPMRGLRHLSFRGFPGCDVGDFSGFAALTQLESLDLSNTNLVDVTPLAALSSLKYLDLTGNDLVNVSPLAQLVGLEGLSLHGNNLTNIDALMSLINLRSLELGANDRLKEIWSVRYMINLTSLSFPYMDVQDVTPLAHLSYLSDLDAKDNGITDFSPIAGLSRLTQVDASKNGVKNVAPFMKLKGLKTLYLQDNVISDAAAVAALRAALPDATIRVEGNPVDPRPELPDERTRRPGDRRPVP